MTNKCTYCDPDFWEDFDLDSPINLEILDQQENKSIFLIQMSETSEEPKQSDSVGTTDDLISREEAIIAVREELRKFTPMAIRAMEVIRRLPSVQPDDSKLAKVLADTLDGTPLLYACDKLWSEHGWCEGHCKPGQQEPDAECWMRYAEVMAG